MTIEQTALRVSETWITWGDVDIDGLRFRLKARRTKSKRGKWVPVASWLMDRIAAACPLEDRLSDVAVFRGVTDDQLRKAMASACKLAGIRSYSPHALRHRRITLWHYQGIPLREIQDRVVTRGPRRRSTRTRMSCLSTSSRRMLCLPFWEFA